MCECRPGFEGDGYVCAGSVLFSVAFLITVQDHLKNLACNTVEALVSDRLRHS